MSEISAVIQRGGAAGISPEARLYAVKELARRAGVTAEFFRSWKVACEDDATTVHVQPGTENRVRFKHTRASLHHDRPALHLRTARAEWWQAPAEPIRALVPDFVVPFVDGVRDGTGPLFAPVTGDLVECGLDLPLSILLSLSRWEEQLPGDRDAHERFPSSASIAVRDGFLHRPVVDEYGLALEQALRYLLPAWRPAERRLRVNMSHDIDVIGLPFNFAATIGHSLRRRNLGATVRDLVGWVGGLAPSYLEAVRWLVLQSLDRGLDAAVYWKAGPPGPLDSGYDPRHPKVQRVIEWLRTHGVEMGVHPDYETFRRPERLQSEVRILRTLLGDQPLGGRQHYLRWSPEVWSDWEDCGLAYDSTVGYADRTGFRAGTCIPYRPWLLSANREARLIEIPLVVMEGTLLEISPVRPHEHLDAFLGHLPRCRLVGGVFTLLWHNNYVVDPALARLYREILDQLVGHPGFDWRTPSKELY